MKCEQPLYGGVCGYASNPFLFFIVSLIKYSLFILSLLVSVRLCKSSTGFVCLSRFFLFFIFFFWKIWRLWVRNILSRLWKKTMVHCVLVMGYRLFSVNNVSFAVKCTHWTANFCTTHNQRIKKSIYWQQKANILKKAIGIGTSQLSDGPPYVKILAPAT